MKIKQYNRELFAENVPFIPSIRKLHYPNNFPKKRKKLQFLFPIPNIRGITLKHYFVAFLLLFGK